MNRSTVNIGLLLTLVVPVIAISAKAAQAQPITFEQQDERSPQQQQQLQLANQCRSKPDETSETSTEESDRPSDEDCQELELIPQPSTQPRLLRIELPLPAGTKDQPDTPTAP